MAEELQEHECVAGECGRCLLEEVRAHQESVGYSDGEMLEVLCDIIASKKPINDMSDFAEALSNELEQPFWTGRRTG